MIDSVSVGLEASRLVWHRMWGIVARRRFSGALAGVLWLAATGTALDAGTLIPMHLARVDAVRLRVDLGGGLSDQADDAVIRSKAAEVLEEYGVLLDEAASYDLVLRVRCASDYGLSAKVVSRSLSFWEELRDPETGMARKAESWRTESLVEATCSESVVELSESLLIEFGSRVELARERTALRASEARKRE